MLSVAKPYSAERMEIRRMVERVCREVVVGYSRNLPGIFLEGVWKTVSISWKEL
jgi:hypothetical protein